MSDVHDTDGAPDAAPELGPRIDAMRELIGLLAISPTAVEREEELPQTVETFRHLSERLSRLLEQAGMVDCLRAIATIEQAIADLPSAESLRDIDAGLTYIRARVHDVSLPGGSPAASAPVDSADAPSSISALGEAAAGAITYIDEASIFAQDVVADDDEALDESQFSDKTKAIIRTFKNTPLRQRSPGEITWEARQPAQAFRDDIPDYLRRECLSEATSDLADLRTLIASFGKMPGSLDDLRDMAQLGHKVKGTVSTYLFDTLAEVLHSFEGVPRVLQPVAISRAAACLNLLIRFADVIETAIQEAGEQGDASQTRLLEAQSLVAEANDLAATQATEVVGSASVVKDEAAVGADPATEPATLQLPGVHRAVDEESLRVEPRQLDSLMHQSDSLAMNRAMLTQSSDEIQHVQSDMDLVLARLASLSAQLTDLHPFIRQTADRGAMGTSGPRWLVRQETSVGTWDDLELDSLTIFDASLRQLSEAVLDATTLSNSLHALIQQLTRNSDAQRAVLHSMQQAIIHMRLVSLKTVADRVLLTAHQAAQSVGRQVEVSITGQNTEIDRNISEALISPIVQLVRNAIAHGIESSREREAQGKSAAGKVWFHASYSGSEVSIEVGDDGRGINPHQLIAAAVAAKIVESKHADYLTREQALWLMFEPNLSTSEQVGVIAGHGIGLDSVLRDVQRLRGSVSVRSEPKQGTVFQIRVPISLSITRALHVRVADHEYAIPFGTIRQMFMAPEASILVSLPDAEPKTTAARFTRRMRVARPSPERPLRLPDDPTAALFDETPVFSLAELLGLEEAPRANHMALLVDVGQRQVAVLVDEMLDESEVVIRALPAHLRRRAVRGASIMSDGRLLLVLDLADLLTDALGGKTAPHPQPKLAPEPPRQRIPQVLVVDDSISMRRALEGTLSSVGYDVRVARDGVEALGVMIAEVPDIMVLDLEMPRLDGFELLSVIRGNEDLARVPVVILTSRAAEKHHHQAMELGVRAYLTKPCPDEVLITTLQRVLRESQEKS